MTDLKPEWTEVLMTVPCVIVEDISAFAEAVCIEPGELALICLLQGFAVQLRGNGSHLLADTCMELACVIGEGSKRARVKHARLPRSPQESVQ